jgi:SOS response regulatory protein OraA/RecX
MSEAELRELADKLGSRAVARFGELTAKRKAAEEQLEALKAELSKRQAPDPLAAPKKDATNPYKAIETVADLQKKASEVEEVIEWAEETLWSNDHLAADDIVATVDGKELTKAQVRKALRDAQKARKEHLPAQLAALQAKEQRKALKTQLVERARTELGWLDNQDDDVRKHYDNLVSDPRIKQAVEAVPDLEPFMEYMVAHAANSIYARKTIPMDTPKRPQVTPPESPGSVAAQTERPEGRSAKQIKEAEQRLQKSGAISDFIALRQQQLSKRKSI